jgi:hypothetical protein
MYLNDQGLDSGAYRNRLLSSPNGLAYWDESVGRRQFAWDTVNNRWQMVYGDSGIRVITADLVNGWTCSASLYIRRENNTVTLWSDGGLSGAAKTSDTLLTIPTGFRAAQDHYCIAITTATNAALPYILATAGGLTCSSTTAGQRINFRWTTTGAWPTVLPGTASGSIPYA